MVDPQKITVLETEDGHSPFEEWYHSLQDNKTKARILARIDRLRDGNFGDWKSLGEGVFELRIIFGSGYRIYFARVENRIVVLLGGTDKRNQQKDIDKAIKLWEKYKGEIEKFRRGFQ
jgi:putative addiction module killer protein